MIIIETDRLYLRNWQYEDRDRLYQINNDLKVIEFLLGPMNISQVDSFISDMNEGFERDKFSLFAVEIKNTQEMIGFIGLSIPRFEAHFTPCVEIGWRIDSNYWGFGYATEGAKAVLEYAKNNLALKEIVSFTSTLNKRSIKVMERIGMQRDFDGDFIHPKLPENHPLAQHVLYKISL